MKRTPLVRKTPMARTGRIKAKPRPVSDRVNPKDHLAVRHRDGLCFGALALNQQLLRAILRPEDRWLDADAVIEPHECATQFGRAHQPGAIDYLTVDHFHHHAGGTYGDRAKSDREHMVAMCGWLNNRPPPAVIRQAERDYMAWLIARGGA